MIRTTDGGLLHYCFETFVGNQVLQGIFTRLGGSSTGCFSSLNVGHTVGDDPTSVEANHRLIYRALGVPAGNVVTAQQVHGDHVAVVSPEMGGRTIPHTDGLISDVPGLLLLMRFADCVPVSFYAPRRRVVGLAHAGWQGTVKRIAPKTAQAMMSVYGCSPGELYAGLGPAIGPCCFEVGSEVAEAISDACPSSDGVIARALPGGKAYVDLWRANALQLAEIGVTHIETSDLCTCCRHDLFYSHRGEKGHTGRFAAAIGLKERAERNTQIDAKPH